MKKAVLMIIMVFANYAIIASTVFIYIDKSNINDIKKIKEITYNIIDENPQSEIILFISNSNKPITAYTKSGVDDALSKLSLISPSVPDFDNEIEMINKIFTDKNLLKTINSDSRNVDFKFYFIMELSQSIIYNSINRFVDKLLLTNRLMENGKVIDGCKVKIHFKNNENKENNLSKELKNKSYEIYEF